jgi:hypothetical protein
MGSITRAAALAAAASVGLQTADAGFVYSSSVRSVAAATPASSDSGITTAFGIWFDSASSSGAGLTALANQGSNLGLNEMSFVGAAQVLGGNGASASSAADLTFVAFGDDPSASLVDISWIIGLSEDFTGGGTASVWVKLTDLTLGTMRLMLSSDTTAAGTLTVVAGNNYRLEVFASANATSSGSGFGSFNATFSIVPGPATAALLAIAGVVARGRRRR